MVAQRRENSAERSGVLKMQGCLKEGYHIVMSSIFTAGKFHKEELYQIVVLMVDMEQW
jgi:hypothetical protein